MGPGHYKFIDYVKFGLPLTILCWVAFFLYFRLSIKYEVKSKKTRMPKFLIWTNKKARGLVHKKIRNKIFGKVSPVRGCKGLPRKNNS